MKRFILSAVAAGIVLIGCGTTTVNGSAETSDKAQLLDAKVINIDYVTQSGQGVTDDNGSFSFTSKDKNVTFKIGNLVIGTFDLTNLKPDRKIFVGELFGLDRNNTTNQSLVNLLRLLQTLDSDNDIANGITITDAEKGQINYALDNNSSVSPIFIHDGEGALKYFAKILNKKLVLERVARENYKKTLEENGITPDFMPFTMVWNIQQPYQIVNISVNPNYFYDYTVDWGDGSVSAHQSSTASHMYSQSGTYTVKITGTFPAIELNQTDPNMNYDSFGNLVQITKWGDIKWKSFKYAFAGESGLNVISTDTPDLSEVSDMDHAFYMTSLVAANNFENWDVSHVTNMSGMFQHSNFNHFIENWNVSNVKDTSNMFKNSNFNQPLYNWNLMNDLNMSGMFYGCYFTQYIGNWNVSHVTDMSDMFNSASFNSPINDWDVRNVRNMSGMFEHSTFNQALNKWNVGNVQNMSNMFMYDSVFNQPLDTWNVSNVTDMSNMFKYTVFNQAIDTWNVSNVTNMSGMFWGDYMFNQDLEDWNVINVRDMSYMFKNASKFNQPLNRWIVANVTNMAGMFMFASSFNQPLDSWNVANVTDMTEMFSNAASFDQNISMWNVSNVVNYSDFAVNCPINNTDKMPKFK